MAREYHTGRLAWNRLAVELCGPGAKRGVHRFQQRIALSRGQLGLVSFADCPDDGAARLAHQDILALLGNIEAAVAKPRRATNF
jgi:hypothetical protein